MRKRCSMCGKQKDYKNFSKRSVSKTGLRSECKACNKRRYDQNVTNIRKLARKAYALDPRKVMLKHAHVRAIKRNVPFNLCLDDIVIPKVCPVLGIILKIGQGKHNENSPSLDCILPDLGYIADNVMVISMRANRIKNDATLEELQKVCGYLEKSCKQS